VNGLSKFEQRLEQLISGAFAKAFRSAVQPVEISAALQRECDNNAQILSRDRRLVPNDFHVELSGTDLERLAPYDTAMADEMVGQLHEHAEQQGYSFPGPVSIGFEPAEDLTTGRFRIRSQAQASVTGPARAEGRGEGRATRGRAGRTRAVLEVNGTRHPLEAPGLVVGRGTEADLRINDPGVSRRHIEFVVPPGEAAGLEVRDLGSTNGMLVDGRRSTHTRVQDGTTVKIGNTTMTVHVEEGPDV
jgi:hypothetical protein